MESSRRKCSRVAESLAQVHPLKAQATAKPPRKLQTALDILRINFRKISDLATDDYLHPTGSWEVANFATISSVASARRQDLGAKRSHPDQDIKSLVNTVRKGLS